jgi:hypothetical protein
MAGRLAKFAEAWRTITDSHFVIRSVTSGYLLEFRESPPLMAASEVARMETVFRGERASVMDAETASLLEKGAIERVASTPGFFSRVFFVPKKDGRLRPIINLKPLNKFIWTQHFSMPTVKDVSHLLQKDDFAVCLDLKDAYFHVPVHPRHRRFLMFRWRGRSYQFTCLPFGLASSPRTFCRVTKPVVHRLRSLGIRTLFYLDDILILGNSREQASKAAQETVSLLHQLEFSLKWEKSDMSPS